MLKATNRKDYRIILAKFLVAWVLATGLVVFACLQYLTIPYISNKESDSIELIKMKANRDSVLQVIDSIGLTLKELQVNHANNEDISKILDKLKSYTNTKKIHDVDMETKLSGICNHVVDFVEDVGKKKNESKNKLEKCEDDKSTCEEDLDRLSKNIQTSINLQQLKSLQNSGINNINNTGQ